MDPRYADDEINKIWSEENKLFYWQRTELAVIEAAANLKILPRQTYENISSTLKAKPIDRAWWKEKEKEINHDLNAFIEERLRFLPPDLQVYFHRKITSYDTEEPAFAQMLRDSLAVVNRHCDQMEEILIEMALKYRFTIMNGRTHGQEAELQSFGKRCLSWLQDLRIDENALNKAAENLKYSKLSGAIGNYGSIDPEIEKEALRLMGFKPYYGATQIMPREIYAPLAEALCQTVMTLNKIAVAIRLGARSGRPIFQEPFGKKQKGSSAMPHKKNTIFLEKLEGMLRMAMGYLSMILNNITTWEERAIEQSSVERNAWPDLFHVTVHSFKVMEKILKGLNVYPDNMLLELVDSRGSYASSEAKELLKDMGLPFGLTVEDAYRIVQLAAFNAFEPKEDMLLLRKQIPASPEGANDLLQMAALVPRGEPVSIKDIISEGKLRVCPELEMEKEKVEKNNSILRKIFYRPENREYWEKIFTPSYLLRNEARLFREILEENN